jgi:hypothetical protein
MVRKIRICGREYDLKFDPSISGAHFSTCENSGRGSICIGTKVKDINWLADLVLHESIEAILCEDNMRLYRAVNGSKEFDYTFVFNHEYFSGFTNKLLDAMKSSGFFVVRDGRYAVQNKKDKRGIQGVFSKRRKKSKALKQGKS